MFEFLANGIRDLWETEGFAAGLAAGAALMLPVVILAYWSGGRRALRDIVDRVDRSFSRSAP